MWCRVRKAWQRSTPPHPAATVRLRCWWSPMIRTMYLLTRVKSVIPARRTRPSSIWTIRPSRDWISRCAAAACSSPAGGKSPASSGRSFLLRPLALCAGLLLFLVSFQTDNLVYTMSATAHRATESFATRLVERVESTPGYEDGMEVVIIGGFPRSSYYSQIEAFKEIEDYSNLSSTVTPLTKQVYYYLNDWLNVPWPEPSEETLIAVSDSAAFREMPLYPSDGGIVISDGRVIVKLAKRYTPKKDYEIAYENRR